MHLYPLQQLIHLFIAQLLAQTRQHISQLSRANKPVPVLIKHLESTNELIGCTGRFESIRTIEDVEEAVVVDFLRCGVGEIRYFGLGWVLTECAKKVT